MAVEESERIIPNASAACHDNPANTPIVAMTMAVTVTCNPPKPTMAARIRHSSAGELYQYIG